MYRSVCFFRIPYLAEMEAAPLIRPPEGRVTTDRTLLRLYNESGVALRLAALRPGTEGAGSGRGSAPACR